MIFAYGYLSTWVLTEIAKNFVGELRPHFLAVCQPSFDCSALTSAQFASFNSYLLTDQNFTCLNPDTAAVREARYVSTLSCVISTLKFGLVDRFSVDILHRCFVSRFSDFTIRTNFVYSSWLRLFSHVYSCLMVMASSWYCRSSISSRSCYSWMLCW